MIKALFAVIVVGAGIGAMMPASTPVPSAGAVAEAAPARGGPPPAEVRLRREGNGHFYVHAEVNGQLARFVVDTGASMVALTVEDAKRLGVRFDEADFQIVGSGASGAVRGQMVTLDRVVVEGREVRGVSGAVLEGLPISLLGQSFLTRIGTVEMSGDNMILR
ncbi:MAG TPA: TIGR02281 family clan AA aspartic protease [Allosphingosinicella sp.]|nr:TIGR02281 family clan AA aspartic protease [Allosphingosinicella sp.]